MLDLLRKRCRYPRRGRLKPQRLIGPLLSRLSGSRRATLLALLERLTTSGSLKFRAGMYDYMRTTVWSSKQATNQEPYVSHLDALAQLLEQCRNGIITVRGSKRGKGESEEIPVCAWRDRIIDDTIYGVVCFVNDSISNETWWDGLQFLRTEIQSCWPSRPRSHRKVITASEKPKPIKSRSRLFANAPA